MSTEADDAAHAQARQLEADNPLWLVIFGVYSKEFVCFPRFGVTSRPDRREGTGHAATSDAANREFRTFARRSLQGQGEQLAQRKDQSTPLRNGDILVNDTLAVFERTHLERLKLAADVLLSEHDAITDPMESELTLFRERVEHALLLPGPGSRETRDEQAGP